ncbi:hypothetical protein NG798_23285 [Ancylothrix sp. C2]|nr:hypothetical protein [Ancylothrix sp. D3o]
MDVIDPVSLEGPGNFLMAVDIRAPVDMVIQVNVCSDGGGSEADGYSRAGRIFESR